MDIQALDQQTPFFLSRANKTGVLCTYSIFNSLAPIRELFDLVLDPEAAHGQQLGPHKPVHEPHNQQAGPQHRHNVKRHRDGQMVRDEGSTSGV